MKPTQITELFANIKATFVSFFSIMMFVAMGIGVFTGINWSGPALETAADGKFNEGALHHYQITFPYGLTDDDLAKLSAIEGVDDVEAGRQSIQTVKHGDEELVVKVEEIGKRIDIPGVLEGTLPQKAGEVALKGSSAQKMGVKVGDTVRFEHDTESDDDGMKYLVTGDYKVTGLVESSEYIAWSSETYGFTSTGNGSIDAIAWVLPEAFDAEAFHDGYPVANVRSESLAPLFTFSDEYDKESAIVEARIKELGDTLGDARFDELHTEAQKQIDDGQKELDDAAKKIKDAEKQLADADKQIKDGEKQIEDGEQQLKDGYAKIADGEAELAAGKKEFNSKTAGAKKKLNEAKKKLDSAQKEYNEVASTLEDAKKANNELQAKYKAAKAAVDAAQNKLDSLKSTYSKLKKQYEAGEIPLQKFIDGLLKAYNSFKGVYDKVRSAIQELNKAIDEAAAKYPDVTIKGDIPVPAALPNFPKNIGEGIDSWFSDLIDKAQSELDAAKSKKITVAGETLSLDEAAWIAPIASKEITKAEKKLSKKKDQLDAGRKKYEDAEAQYNKAASAAQKKIDSAEARLADARAQAAQGEATLADMKQKLADGKAEYKKKSKELKKAKKDYKQGAADLEEAKHEFGLMKDYGWSVASRAYNGGATEVSVFSGVTDRLSFSMAALFLIVGLLVSYSAVSRIVHEEITRIGTKKALGFRKGEITLSFLAYAGIAVIAGAIIGLLVAVFVVETIIGGALGDRFIMGTYASYFGVPLAIIITLLEMALVLGATYLACRGILKQHAVELLRGEKPPAAKQRFYEKWGIWNKLPLFTQTMVNNCVNDKRRVFSTIVGVAGCTALVVTAVTLNNDVLASYDKHYEDVYGFNGIVYVDDQKAADGVVEALQAEGAQNVSAVLHQRFALELPSGEVGSVTLVVPQDLDKFQSVYHVNSVSGGVPNLAEDGIWMSRAYASHMGAKVGDEVVINATDGSQVRLTIAGFDEFYLTYNEIVMGHDAYEKSFDTKFAANAVLLGSGEDSLDKYAPAVKTVEGAQALFDDKTHQHGNFEAFSSVSSTVVLIYLVLAILMAIVVLLNLNVMFIEEKKRELIVLMINGFSVKDAKKYIYNDTIVLTVIGILCGLILGAIMGSITVGSIEPETASFFKGIDGIALLAGTVVSALLAAVMSFIALRRIPAFKLTDINKF